jgi:molecular chaperone GrpE
MMKLNLVSDLFPVLDSFDMAFSNKEAWEKVDPAWRTGVEYIYTQFKNILDMYNLSVIDTVGIDFNPKIHEPMEHAIVDTQEQDNTIIKIVQKGYQSGEIVLRPAKVIVGKYENTGN